MSPLFEMCVFLPSIPSILLPSIPSQVLLSAWKAARQLNGWMKFGVAGLKLENSGSLLSAFSWWDDGKTGTWETSGSENYKAVLKLHLLTK